MLDHARELVEHHEGAGRPRPIWLRRAVSSAYYAAFHAIALATVRQVLPNGSSDDHYRLCRSIGHAEVKQVCVWVESGAGKTHASPIAADVHTDTRLLQMARLVQRLQDARHLADYDHLATFDKAEALLHVNAAQRVLGLLSSRAGDPRLEALLALVALHTRLR